MLWQDLHRSLRRHLYRLPSRFPIKVATKAAIKALEWVGWSAPQNVQTPLKRVSAAFSEAGASSVACNQGSRAALHLAWSDAPPR
jgi:hypothetical protein